MMDKQLNLTNAVRATSAYKKKSTLPFWSSLKDGDILEFILLIRKIVRGESGLHATYIRVVKNNQFSFKCSITQLAKYLQNFDYEEIP